jgi:hypothetical protein
MDPKAGEVWALMYAGEPDECDILQVRPEAIRIVWLRPRWLTRKEFNERAVCRVGRVRLRRGWRKWLYGLREVIRD